MIGGNLDWSEAQWQNRAYLQLLSDPTVELTLPGTLLLAAGLAGKEPGQTALAVDALVQALREDRVDVPMLGGVMRDMVRSSLAKSARYARSLQAALRIEPALSPGVIELLCVMLEASPDDPPRDTALLLALLHETVVATRYALTERERTTISRLKLSGRARAAQEALLRV